MDKFIARRSLEEEALTQYVEKAGMVDHLYLRLGELEDTIEAFDKNIDEALSIGLDDIANSLCEMRNQLNLSRLDLEEQIHKLELDLVEFEKVRMHTK